MFLAKQPIIRCPHCGYEYLPAEIVFPNSLLGRPVNTVRDALGKILYTEYQDGHDPETTESYICDNCNK